jgi:hypothetical protein
MKGFIFLTDPIFTKVSDFNNGYAEVEYTRYLDGNGEITRQSYAKTIDIKREYISYNGKRFSEKELAIADSLTRVIPKRQVDLIAFKENDLWGYKRPESYVKIKPKYKAALPFKNGFARVNFENEKGLINDEGHVVLYDEFYLTGDVYNDILWYQKFIYKRFLHGTGFGWEERTEKHTLFGYLIYTDLQPELGRLTSQYSNVKSKLVGQMPQSNLDSIHRELRTLEYKIHHILRVKSGESGKLTWEGY